MHFEVLEEKIKFAFASIQLIKTPDFKLRTE